MPLCQLDADCANMHDTDSAARIGNGGGGGRRDQSCGHHRTLCTCNGHSAPHGRSHRELKWQVAGVDCESHCLGLGGEYVGECLAIAVQHHVQFTLRDVKGWDEPDGLKRTLFHAQTHIPVNPQAKPQVKSTPIIAFHTAAHRLL
jgi:hypothetical protein